MKTLFLLILSFSCCSSLQAASEPGSTYDVVLQSKKCKVYEHNGNTGCRFEIDEHLIFEVAGVGMVDASVVFEKSDIDDGSYYVKFATLHGCLIVMGKGIKMFDPAFVNPRTANVFQNYISCAKDFD